MKKKKFTLRGACNPLLSKKEYCRDFGNTIKETTKRLSSSTFCYFTSEKKSWYPEPEHDIPVINRRERFSRSRDTGL